MSPVYEQWIDEHYPTKELCYLQCATATLQMVKAFPELLRVRGFYCGRPHWWLLDTDGGIVDPTAKQFNYGGLYSYEEWDETLPEPKGKCKHCGELSYDDPNFCSEACWKATKAILEGKADYA